MFNYAQPVFAQVFSENGKFFGILRTNFLSEKLQPCGPVTELRMPIALFCGGHPGELRAQGWKIQKKQTPVLVHKEHLAELTNKPPVVWITWIPPLFLPLKVSFHRNSLQPRIRSTCILHHRLCFFNVALPSCHLCWSTTSLETWNTPVTRIPEIQNLVFLLLHLPKNKMTGVCSIDDNPISRHVFFFGWWGAKCANNGWQ